MSQVPNRSTGEQSTNAIPGNRAGVEPEERKDTEPGARERTESGEGENRGARADSLDAIFQMLAAQRRRYALYVLSRHAGPITLADLADEVASLEETTSERVATSLHHVHLPKLDDAGVADYDAEARTARLADHSDRFRHYLVSAAKDERQFLGPAFEGAARTGS